MLKRGWLVGLLWTSEPASVRAAREAALTAVHRAAYILRRGQAQTLREMLAQEGHAMAKAGCLAPKLEAGELARAREALAPYLDAVDRPTVMACLFGDPAAAALGYEPKGLRGFAGLALALHDARAGLSQSSKR
jgi:hypothetical protein